ncbi:MAG: hypothetical protein PHF18_16380 [Methanosarcina sp.]|uniref:hypothetical protein n=1 Tax=Methanosarcina sp. TaxID=2213 RepID=UPI00262182A7|nr:hypothetical protein [Methanosarcina sp.]MDD3248408.1 hypothetical protein [Methanosarcina sp.]
MWYNDKTVVRTHTKNGTQMCWAIVNGVPNTGWIRIKPATVDGVSNVFLILSLALATGRHVDVYIPSGEIEQATLR